MEFEGQDKVIPLKGIERAGKDTVSADGAMNEVIGLIARDGSFVPYMPTDMGLNKMNGVLMVRVHHTSTGDNLILVREPDGITGSDGVKIEYADADTYRDNGYCTNNLTSSQATSVHGDDVSPQVTSVRGTALFGEVKEIVFVGNRMDVETDTGIEHYLWQNGEYVRLTGGESGNNYVLPSVDFKVRAGIYTGDKVHKVAQLVRIEKNYDETLVNARACPNKQSKYVETAGNIGNYALALQGSIRHAGGITGYVLVAAAYHIKETSGNDSKYIMASPVVLMGAPEIYQKDGVASTSSYTKALPNGRSYMLDVLDYRSEFSKNIAGTTPAVRKSVGGINSQVQAFKTIDAAEDSGWSDTTDVYQNIRFEDNGKFIGAGVVLRTIGDYKALGMYVQSSSYPENEGMLYIPNSDKTSVRSMLFGSKYAVYNHHNQTGTADGDAEHKGICVLQSTGNILSLRINSDIAEQYENEIDKLVVFISPIVSPYETEQNGDIAMASTLQVTEHDAGGGFITRYGAFFFDKRPANGDFKCTESACGGGFMPKMKPDDKLRKEIGELQNLYEIKSIPFKDIKKGDWIDIDLSGGKIDSGTLENNNPLPLSALRKVNIINGHIFGYNERLHVYNYSKSTVQRVDYNGIRYNGQASQGQYGATNDNVYHYAIVVTDKNGSKVVKAFDSTCAAINPIVSYPDTGAKRITVIKRFQRYGKYYAGKKDYTPEVFAGQFAAYYITKDLRPLNIETKVVSLTEYQNAIHEEQIMPDSLAFGKNEIRVSDVGLTTFPDSNSYKVGKGEIIGLARLTMGLSQDNFGRFPLVIFTTDGVYTMETDTTGAGAYTAQSPMSRMICTNKDSICELDGAVLFATEYGLMMLTSDGVKPVAHHANGTPKTTIASEGLTMYRNAIRHEKITEMEDAVSDEDFVAYIQMKGTTIRYIHTLNMVVIYNPLMAYSYMMELSEFVVTKVEKQITMDDQDYPKQTFYLQKKVRTRLRITRTRNDGGEIIDVKQATEAIDTESLLRAYLEKQVYAALLQLKRDTTTEKTSAEEDGAALAAEYQYYKNLPDDDPAFADQNKTDMLSELLATIMDKHGEMRVLQTRLDDIDEAIRLHDAGASGYNQALAKVGVESTDDLLQAEKDGKADYTELRKQLRQEEITRAYGYIDENIQQLPMGRMVLEKQADGTWKWGKSIVTTTALNGVGFFPATDMPAGDRYVIDVENTQPVAVQFDYNVPEGNVQCLLQSRPIKLDSTQLKSAYRVVLRGTFEKGDDISVESKNGSTFNITDKDKLLRYCQAGTTLYFKSKLVHVGNRPGTTVWYWEDADGNEVELNKYGIELATSVEKKSDTLTLSIREHYAGLYVFGSLDGEHWMPVGGTEKLLSYNRFHDIGVRTHRVSVKYMLVVFTGYLSTDSHIDGMEITTETRYNDKLK